MRAHFILYVKDQARSAAFYSALLAAAPVLDEPGMTEFQISAETKLGIMPESGISRLLGDSVPAPASGNGIPRCEIYLHVDAPGNWLARALSAGAVLIDTEEDRDWGDSVAYCADMDGHILAFARTIEPKSF